MFSASADEYSGSRKKKCANIGISLNFVIRPYIYVSDLDTDAE